MEAAETIMHTRGLPQLVFILIAAVLPQLCQSASYCTDSCPYSNDMVCDDGAIACFATLWVLLPLMRPRIITYL